MSRHRSPAAGATGDTATVDGRRLGAVAGGPQATVSRSGSTHCALRRGLTAAAVASGALAVAAPVAALLPAEADTASTVRVELAATTDLVEEPEFLEVDGALLAAGVLPVRHQSDPPAMDAAARLLKSADLNTVARRAEEERLAREARVNCAADLSAIGAVKPHVREAARFLSCLFDEPDLIGVAGRGRVSDHPTGLALDLMTSGAEGDRIAACALANRAALGVSYVIWEQRINYGSGWERMENRGGVTENHFDHVHISFERGAGAGDPDPDLCT
ncbi:hypothetical protein [Pseudonocardia xishanensis]|uniref:ARB-07466-like C-terminal domain-containing protein n=1 Tax=Pseudonocardia xishanensis TaxID=630995 RepID=A0ABP8RZ21_9PSEU